MPSFRFLRALPLLIVPLLAASAPTAAQGDESRAAGRRNCGFEAALRDFFARRRAETEDSFGSRPARACGPPEAVEIASACAVEELVPTGRERDPGVPDYDMPDYRVRGARCRLVSRDGSEAYCRFELGHDGPAPAWRKTRMRFRYRFGIVSDDEGHPAEYAMWHAAGICAAGEAPAAH
jgi:hypothetical protein